MRRFLATLALVLALFGAGSVLARPVSAQVNTGLTQVGQTINLPSTDPRIIATRIINVALGLIGIILVALIVYAGFLYMTSGGEAEKTSKARQIIISAVIGLVIILSAWAIARFVIDRLLAATGGGGGGTTTSQGGGSLGGFGGGGASNVFQVRSISPQGPVALRNVEVKMLFSRPVDEKTASAIVVTQDGGTTVGGTFSVDGSIVTFTPADACPPPNGTLKCFAGNADFTVQVGSTLRSVAGQSIVCGGFAPSCQAKFHTGNIVDTQPPAVSMSTPLDGQGIPADSLVTLGASANDDSGISYISFADGANQIDQVGPSTSTTPLLFSGNVQWDTAGLALQSIHQLTAKAFDADTNSSVSQPVSVVVRSATCFDGVQNGDETGIDCGGTPNTPGYCGACSGGSCSSNSVCASGTCQAGVCVDQPIITGVSPQDGRPGTYVTITGSNFGTVGTVTFLGGPTPADDKVAAPLPPTCSNAWQPNQIIVAVPDGAATGPIRVSNDTSKLTDESNDNRGPKIPDFLVNDVSHPGLCQLQPNEAFAGTQFTAVGQGFGPQPDSMVFGNVNLTSFSSWNDTQAVTNVPVIPAGVQQVVVKAGSSYSNPIDFSVLNKSTAGPPTIMGVNPQQGPQSEYVTVSGKNFGDSVGTVHFLNKTNQQDAIGDTAFPAACSANFWHADSVVVKVPSQFTNKQGIIPGDYSITLTRSDNASSNAVDFTVTTGTAKPGICAISPTMGPEGTPVTIVGERLGSDTGSVTFYSSKSALVSSWADSGVNAAVPVAAVTGPVTVSVQSQTSNGINFEVGNCNASPDACGSGTCCANGTCVAAGQVCASASQHAMFAWQSSTGLIPVAPRVVEECLPGQVPMPVPSPSPWDQRPGGNNVCVSASIMVRFTTHLDPTTVTKSDFLLKKCTSTGTDPCATTEDVLLSDKPYLQPASTDQDLVSFQPIGDMQPKTTYLVQVLTGVKGNGAGGDFMEENAGKCGKGVAYCFRFATRDSTAPCVVGGVSVSPVLYTLNDAGATVNYLASPVSQDDKCVVLQCQKYNWDWQHGDQNTDPRASFKTPLQVNGSNIGCEQVGIAQSETGSSPVQMKAIALPDNVPGVGQLYVKFIPPQVEDYFPNCDKACINAEIWARFNREIDPSTLAGNVVVQKCGNENCVVSELSAPLTVPSTNIKLVTVPKSTDLMKRLLTIDPTTSLEPSAHYRVLLRGGATGIRGMNGVPMTGLNDPEGFVWTFQTKLGADAFCKVDSVDVAPAEKYETVVGARQLFRATPYSKPDECSASGQTLVQSESMVWSTSDASVADFYGNGAVSTNNPLPAGCTGQCLATGAQAQYGKVAVCGNEIIETTDQKYCVQGKTLFGDACSILPAGADAGEECDPKVQGDAGLCDPQTCLWKPVATVNDAGTCGNGTIDLGEACDFGSFCMGAAPTSTTPDMTPCTDVDHRATCIANGGTCAPRQYRGCSANCRHTGSQSVPGSVCGNGTLGDGEDCDYGSVGAGGCSAQCLHTGSKPTVYSVCGNGILEPGETCEKLKPTDAAFPAGCNPQTCLHTGVAKCAPGQTQYCCGDGKPDEPGKDCDGGEGCSDRCLLEGSSVDYSTPSFCGDGQLTSGEQCEAGIPSNDPRLASKALPQSSVPNQPVGSVIGGVTDNSQLAYIVGNGTVDAKGTMSAKIDAALQGQTGEATYGLQCGFTDETSCKDGYGLTDQGCCDVRPQIQTAYPQPGAQGVCRNTQVKVTFNVPMDITTIPTNAQVVESVAGATCPQGSVMVGDDFKPVSSPFFAWLGYMWNQVKAWVTGNPALADVWCQGLVKGEWKQATPANTTDFVFTMDHALDPSTWYRIKFFGDNSRPTDPLGDNNDPKNKVGVKSARGVVAPFDTAGLNGKLTWFFTTGANICSLSLIKVTDTTKPHPYLFVANQEQHPFVGEPISLQDKNAALIQTVPEYGWTWTPWVSSNPDVVTVGKPTATQVDTTQVTAQNKNGSAFVMATVKIISDTLAPASSSTTGRIVQGTAPVTVSLCENPWPTSNAPFRDMDPSRSGAYPDFGTSIFANGPYYNFSTTYCRDNAASSTAILPNLKINYVPTTSVDQSEGILRQYLFTYGDDHPELKKDGIGIRIASNPMHYSPEDWYAVHGFGGKPKTILIDGYRALQDDTTIYVSAANTEGAGRAIYSNIYVISHNPDASPTTLDIFNQMVESLSFNVNMTYGVGNICEESNDPTLEPSAPALDSTGNVTSCSSDFDCMKLGDATHCGSFKLKLARDTVRIADFQDMSSVLRSVYANENTYPKLTGGTFLAGISNSRWSSWDQELSRVSGTSLPKDPINEFMTCGRCSSDNGVTLGTACGIDSDCSTGQRCLGVDATNHVSTSTDPATCWDASSRTYLCPKIGVSPSRVYQYRAVNSGARYELGAEFEIPEKTGAPWWTPTLTKEISRCADQKTTATFGFSCASDADCRDPKTPNAPVVNGSCKAVGGRFVYQNLCANITYGGAGGTCGDGVVNSGELCELGQTNPVLCTAANNQTGIKLQVCSECRAWVDDPNVSQCNVGIVCGNGRIDLMCHGGPRNGLACATSKDCGSDFSCAPSNEVCDDGVLNGTYGHCNKSCTGYQSYCGDGMISPGEICDNGPSNSSKSKPGNGDYCDTNAGCAISKSCSLDCKSRGPYCGDGVVTAPEECDGTTQSTVQAICSAGSVGQPCNADSDCGTGGKCGGTLNGVSVNSCQGVTKNKCATQLKQCIDPNSDSSTNYDSSSHVTCLADSECTVGNQKCLSVQDFVTSCTTDAQCSTATTAGSCTSYPTAHVRSCNAPGTTNQCKFAGWTDCRVQHYCGDGTIDAGEECDDGSNNGDNKACTSSCKKNVCGDGKVQTNVEECDAGAQNGKVTCTADYGSTCQSCSTQCKFLSSSGGYCGDGVKNGGEQCDGKDGLSGVTCTALGYDFNKNYIFNPFNPSPAPASVTCSPSCTFAGCGRCSDEPGTATIAGQVVDAVYNQVVPSARVSLYYKGALVKQVATNNDGNFTIDTLNDRAECSQYKLVIDKYTDNPCTGTSTSSGLRPSCGGAAFPSWTYPYNVDEGSRGGYWPLNTPTFTPSTFVTSVSPQTTGSATATILLYPRPGVGEAYLSVKWNKDWSNSGVIIGGNANHVIIPKAAAYTVPSWSDMNVCSSGTNAGKHCTGDADCPGTGAKCQSDPKFPADFPITTCDYDAGPTADGHQCVRDITWHPDLKGNNNVSQLPYGYAVCLHTAGETVGGYASSIYNGCPVEGRAACIAEHGNANPNGVCSKGTTSVFSTCVAGTKSSSTLCSKDTDCGAGGKCAQADCNPSQSFWNTCDFYKQGPLTSYFRYSAFTGATEPIQLYWGTWGTYGHSPDFNGTSGNSGMLSLLTDNGFTAMIVTDKQILTVAPSTSMKTCTDPQSCKFWHIADMDPSTGNLTTLNKLEQGRPNGIATYEYDFQGVTDTYCAAKTNGGLTTSPRFRYDATRVVSGLTCDQRIQSDPTAWSKTSVSSTDLEWAKSNY